MYLHSIMLQILTMLEIVPETHSIIAFVDATICETVLEKYDWPWYIEIIKNLNDFWTQWDQIHTFDTTLEYRVYIHQSSLNYH